MRTRFKIAGGVAALVIAGGITAGCGNANAPAPSAVTHLEGDGYTLSRTIPHSEIAQEYSAGSMLNPAWTTEGATGTRGNSTEEVYKLTPQGVRALRDRNAQLVLIGNAGYGDVGLAVHTDPGFLTIAGPTNEMQSQPDVPVTPEPSQPSASAAEPTAGPVGTTFTVRTTDDNGNPVEYKIRLVQVQDPAKADPCMGSANVAARDHLVGLEFYAAGVEGTVHSPVPNTLVGGRLTGSTNTGEALDMGTLGLLSPDYPSGAGLVGPGEHTTGWASLELPDAQKLAQVHYTPDLLSAEPMVTWTVG